MSLSDMMLSLGRDIDELASATGGYAWDRDDTETHHIDPKDLGAKPIPRAEWNRALVVAILVAQQFPHLDRPTPGADPAGFVWLTWRRGSDRFALQCHATGPRYAWEQATSSSRRTFTSQRLEDVFEGLRAVFPRALSLVG
jgi:hypothetical protein